VAENGPIHGSRDEQRHACRHDRRAAETPIGDHVSSRFIRVVLRDGTVIVVMMRLLLPMKDRMRSLLDIAQRLRVAANGQALPEGTDQQEQQGDAVAHGRSLAEGLIDRGGCRRYASTGWGMQLSVVTSWQARFP
jgi:hypothetical protein